MILTLFDTVKMSVHMSVTHSSGAHMVREQEWEDPVDFLEPLGLAYQLNIPLRKRLRSNIFFN
jgi:hypothetical protein